MKNLWAILEGFAIGAMIVILLDFCTGCAEMRHRTGGALMYMGNSMRNIQYQRTQPLTCQDNHDGQTLSCR